MFLQREWSYTFLRAGVGVCGALIVHVFLRSGIAEGALFPKFDEIKSESLSSRTASTAGLFGLDDVLAFVSLLAGEVDGMLEEAKDAILAGPAVIAMAMIAGGGGADLLGGLEPTAGDALVQSFELCPHATHGLEALCALKRRDFVSSIPPSYTGGNIDDWRIGKGATMYYPVAVDGALFSVGDPHAAQGDSEL